MSLPNFCQPPSTDSAFCLPVQGLFADFETGAGAVCPDDDFLDVNPMVQLRVLKAWSDDIAQQQAAALQRLFSAFGNEDLPHARRVAKFVRHCAWSGFEIAPEVIATL